MPTEKITLKGHIIDSLLLPKVLDEILNSGNSYSILELRVGVHSHDPSFARLEIKTPTDEAMVHLLDQLRVHGANPETVQDATLATADVDGSLPPGFYSSTNLETEVRVNGRWLPVQHPEMDCGIVIENGVARTLPMSDVRAGMHL